MGEKEHEQLMLEWWKKTYEIIVEENLDLPKLERLLNESKVALRSDFDNFLAACKGNKIPFLIISGGITDVIHSVLKPYGIEDYPEFNIFSNKLIFQDNKLAGFDDLIINSHNKG